MLHIQQLYNSEIFYLMNYVGTTQIIEKLFLIIHIGNLTNILL